MMFVADGLRLGEGRRRASGAESWLLGLSFAVLALSYWRFAPNAAGDWKGAATQAHKKLPRTVLFYPAWDREVLESMRELPIVLLDGPAHLDLAGLKEVLFASDTAEPQAVVNNLFILAEWRDFASKPFALLRVAQRSLLRDFASLRVFIEDPPGIEDCKHDGDRFICKDTTVELRREVFGQSQSRCVWVQTPKGRDVTLRFSVEKDDEALKQAALYLGEPDGHSVGDARAALRINDAIAIAALYHEASGHWLERNTPLAPGTCSIEVTVIAEAGVCVDVEVAK